MNQGLHAVLVLLTAGLTVSLAEAQIYKYQDERGRWHFTDKKPDQAAQITEIETTAAPVGRVISAQAEANARDLAAELQARYKPASPIEQATLAVVSIETPLGGGSGFFVSASGYIVTNRHVIRPESSTGWSETRTALEQEEQSLRQRFNLLAREESRLANLREELKRLQFEAENPDLYFNAISPAAYQGYWKNYQSDLADYERELARARRQRNDLNTRKSNFNMRSANSAVTRQFKVTLKDGRSERAELVRIAEGADLALLRIDGYRTPLLQPGNRRPAQGAPVYAIGSPLGQKDAMTAGIITRIDADAIMTDAQILPGNSGGPLIDPAGRLLGVNTQKLMAGDQAGATGFGLAIPFDQVQKAFPELFPSSAR